MIFKNAGALLLGSVNLLYKVLIYAVILSLLFAGLFSAILQPVAEAAGKDFNLVAAWNTAVDTLLKAGTETGDGVYGLFDRLTLFIQENSTLIWQAVGFSALLLFLFTFGYSLLTIPAASIVYSKMASGYNPKFGNAFVANLGKSALYALIFSLITVPCNVAIGLAAFFVAQWLFPSLGVIALTIAAFVLILLGALRIAAFSQWVPLIVIEKISVAKAFCRSFAATRKVFFRILPSLFTLSAAMFALFTTTMITTFGVVPLLVFPACLLLTINIGFVAYFENHQMKFYLDENNIVTHTLQE